MGNGLDKKRFLLYLSSKKLISMLSNEQAGILLKSIFEYIAGGDLPDMDGMTSIVFATIKEYLDRDQKAYEEKCRINRENGGKGGRPKKKPNETQKNRTVLKEPKKNRTKPNETQENPKKPDIDLDSDSDTDSDIDKDIDNDIDKDIDIGYSFKPPTEKDILDFARENNMDLFPGEVERYLSYNDRKKWIRKDWENTIQEFHRNELINQSRKEVMRHDASKNQRSGYEC